MLQHDRTSKPPVSAQEPVAFGFQLLFFWRKSRTVGLFSAVSAKITNLHIHEATTHIHGFPSSHLALQNTTIHLRLPETKWHYVRSPLVKLFCLYRADLILGSWCLGSCTCRRKKCEKTLLPVTTTSLASLSLKLRSRPLLRSSTTTFRWLRTCSRGFG